MIVVKYGGNAMGNGRDLFIEECAALITAGAQLVLIHGGGPQIDAGLAEVKIPERRIAGLRVTDAATLAVTERVLCGTVNKALVRTFARLGIRAVGISGQDGNLLIARAIAPGSAGTTAAEPLGFVGEVLKVQPQLVQALLASGFVPVIAPLGITEDGETALNLNADTAAGAIAGSLRADPYVVITDVPKVRRVPSDPATGLDHLTLAEAKDLLAGGSFDGGMRPKMEAVIAALEAGATRAIVAGGERALSGALAGGGTTITA